MSTSSNLKHTGFRLSVEIPSPPRAHINFVHARPVNRNVGSTTPTTPPTPSRAHLHREKAKMIRVCISGRLALSVALLIGIGSILLLANDARMSTTVDSGRELEDDSLGGTLLDAGGSKRVAEEASEKAELSNHQLLAAELDEEQGQSDTDRGKDAGDATSTEEAADSAQAGHFGVEAEEDMVAANTRETVEQSEDNASDALQGLSKEGRSISDQMFLIDKVGGDTGGEDLNSGEASAKKNEDEENDASELDGAEGVQPKKLRGEVSSRHSARDVKMEEESAYGSGKGRRKRRRGEKQQRRQRHAHAHADTDADASGATSSQSTTHREGRSAVEQREEHPCANFALPPPPADKKRSGPRPCPVCYLPLADAIRALPQREGPGDEVLKELSYVSEADPREQRALRERKAPRFGGHPSLADRADSFRVKERMTVHCGFVGPGYSISDVDQRDMDQCGDIVVASAIFGAYDVLQQPSNVSPRAKRQVCFFMFVDEETFQDLRADGTIARPDAPHLRAGLWRIVIVRNLPFADPRRTGKVPKLLLHRLFPHARFSIWLDAKLELTVDPYRVLERFLWRGQHTFAISKHYKRFDAFVEAEANKVAGKYDNASIDAQMDAYRSDGLTPFSDAKLPITSDVPEGCFIVREHTPVTNLFGCLWFNEVDRYTSRDQLSFGYTRDKVLAATPWHMSMFLDCERRNVVVQAYHKPLLIERGTLAAKKEGG
eukprot:jgi/Mesen1/1941/ME000146S01026